MKTRNTGPRGAARPVFAFTLIELLVTLSMISVLAGMLAASITNGHAKAKVTRCTNNFRQLGIAVNLYTADGNGGLFPSPMLRTATSGLTNYGSIEPTFVDLSMITILDAHGVSPEMYFCPTRRRWRDADNFYRAETGGRPIQTSADLVSYYRLQGACMAFLDIFWWVPRPLEGLGEMKYPDPTCLEARIPQPWPTKNEDDSARIKPIASDWLVSQWDNERRAVVSASGGHSLRTNIRSNNALFADGHVETTPFVAVRWQLLNNRRNLAYLY
jgi:prepilin-type N-terminal cleavage/methylation domain-containing protein/prepilin-type processing-associated H-X9-DG protein